MTKTPLRTSLVVAFSLTAAAAFAQTPAAPRDPNMPDPKNVPAEKVAPSLEPGTTGSTGSNLSEKLNKTDGVIRPPAIGDSEMRIPAPKMDNDMVIKPPGGPGPNPGPDPK